MYMDELNSDKDGRCILSFVIISLTSLPE
jgi:hypothetical protein